MAMKYLQVWREYSSRVAPITRLIAKKWSRNLIKVSWRDWLQLAKQRSLRRWQHHKIKLHFFKTWEDYKGLSIQRRLLIDNVNIVATRKLKTQIFTRWKNEILRIQVAIVKGQRSLCRRMLLRWYEYRKMCLTEAALRYSIASRTKYRIFHAWHYFKELSKALNKTRLRSDTVAQSNQKRHAVRRWIEYCLGSQNNRRYLERAIAVSIFSMSKQYRLNKLTKSWVSWQLHLTYRRRLRFIQTSFKISMYRYYTQYTLICLEEQIVHSDKILFVRKKRFWLLWKQRKKLCTAKEILQSHSSINIIHRHFVNWQRFHQANQHQYQKLILASNLHESQLKRAYFIAWLKSIQNTKYHEQIIKASLLNRIAKIFKHWRGHLNYDKNISRLQLDVSFKHYHYLKSFYWTCWRNEVEKYSISMNFSKARQISMLQRIFTVLQVYSRSHRQTNCLLKQHHINRSKRQYFACFISWKNYAKRERKLMKASTTTRRRWEDLQIFEMWIIWTELYRSHQTIMQKSSSAIKWWRNLYYSKVFTAWQLFSSAAKIQRQRYQSTSQLLLKLKLHQQIARWRESTIANHRVHVASQCVVAFKLKKSISLWRYQTINFKRLRLLLPETIIKWQYKSQLKFFTHWHNWYQAKARSASLWTRAKVPINFLQIKCIM
ncbi:hypothetical protein THRCLA_20435 [Thraustotheca clavata]|uniref:Sfi1 spindle body domain-containing protein n=1 Tax=Thraustotheca clavata TaxID=74557 RepID=A0A1W0A7H8_9STRA|nr:hypothetical protein THRCLA_20435 [Thraustotheca clavata]